ncbi:hypothetical protein OAB57_00480 [Bacteriovoracaceae bacterium]|nr:hypothetical protein [Bacteriovoracaceae bacterium]
MAYLASLFFNFLIAIQPKLVGLFINEVGRDVNEVQLYAIILFMVFGALLAFLFDTISCAIKLGLKVKMEDKIHQIYFRYCLHHTSAQRDISLRRGLSGMVDFTLNITLELSLIVSQILMIILFLFMDARIMGVSACVMCLMGIPYSKKLAKYLGKITRFKFSSKVEMIGHHREQRSEKYFNRLKWINRFEQNRFILDTELIALSFFIFTLFPIGVLALYVMGFDISVGSIATTFLYFSMLKRPYRRLTEIIRLAGIHREQTKKIRGDIEIGIFLSEKLKAFDRGCFWIKEGVGLGATLSAPLGDEKFCLYYDDNNDLDHLDKQLSRIQREAHKRPILVFSSNPAVAKYAHFLIEKNGITPVMRVGTNENVV